MRNEGRDIDEIARPRIGVPQTVVYTLQQVLSQSIINKTKRGFNESKTNMNGFRPAIPRVDTCGSPF
jgi:hypothetical protein